MSTIELEQAGNLETEVSFEKKIPVKKRGTDLPIYIFLGASALFCVVAFIALDLDWGKVIERIPKLGEVAADMLTFSGEKFNLTVTTMLETIATTILAIIYGLIIGLIVGALGAKNVAPWKPLASFIQCVLTFVRAVPTTVWALLILACMGFGMAAGIVGLLFHTVAFFGKVFAQTFEEVPEETIEALKAAGANRIQIFFGAVLPASLTGLIAWSALRFEITFGEAAILGMVGAGGIGYTIMAAVNGYQLGRAGLAVVIVFVFAYLIEVGTTTIKEKMKVI